MIRLAAAVLLLVAPPADNRGFAAHYRPQIMENVSRNRGLPIVDCMVAITHDHRIGAWVTVTSHTTGERLRCRITDVCNAGKGHCRALARRGIVAEIGWSATGRLCAVKRYGEKSPRECSVSVSRG